MAIGDQPTRALYTSDDDGTTTDVSVVPKKKSGHKRDRRGGRRGGRSLSGSQTDSSSASSVSSRTGKKMGVTAKVSIPEYYGKEGHINHVPTFRAWARSITYYSNYYEDHYLFPLVVASVKDYTTEMFDFACSNKRGEKRADCEDLGQIVQRMREHYCGAFTFREQQIQVENMKQGDSEEVADFLVKVTNAVNGLAKDWKGHLTEEELDTLQYEVFLNGVNKEIRHVLNAEAVKHPHMTPDQMYTAVRRFESYVARNERLNEKEATPTQAKTPKASSHATPCYKHGFHETTAFKAAAAATPEEEGSKSESSGREASEEPEDVQEDQTGLFLPEFLRDMPDGDWGLHVRLAQTMQAEEKWLRCCFLCQNPDHLMHDCLTAKNGQRPLKLRGPAKNKSARVEAKAKPKAKAQGQNPAYTRVASTAGPSQVKGREAPYLNPDPFLCWIGPKNLSEAVINGELTTCLLDNGAQLNFITPAYTRWRNMNVFPLERLAEEVGEGIPPIQGIGGIMVQPTGFVVVRVQILCVAGYDKDQVAIVLDDPGMKECPVILGMPTLYQVMKVIKESEITTLAMPWVASRVSWLMGHMQACMDWVVHDDVANKPISLNSVDEVVKVSKKFQVPPFGHKVIHGHTRLVLTGCRLNIMTHGLEMRSPRLPLGVDILSTCATLATGSGRVAVVLRNNTDNWVEVDKGTPIARMVLVNQMPSTDGIVGASKPQESPPALTEAERHALLMDKLDLVGLEMWPEEEAAQARSLLKQHHDLFSLEKHEIGQTKAVTHKIILRDPDTPPFKERFQRIPPPQVDEVREHLKLMLDTGAICPSNSPWCNAVVLVRKKDGSLRFCIYFRRLNALSKKDSHPYLAFVRC